MFADVLFREFFFFQGFQVHLRHREDSFAKILDGVEILDRVGSSDEGVREQHTCKRELR